MTDESTNPVPPEVEEELTIDEQIEAVEQQQAQEHQMLGRLLNLTLRRFGRYLKFLFDLKHDSDEAQTVEDIKRSIVFRGANLWTLVFSIFVASIGLNTNSTAVIIGAMLISPLMGPIMGAGLSIGTNDLDLLKRSMKNLGVAVTISILTSTIYFLISPLNEAQSELLARTNPTIFDVLIAIFGGAAGIIASSRVEKTNAIPGVAIATALMPPLCTAGFGLATANYTYFFGAFYLFFINSVFICLTTVITVRYLNFSKVTFLDSEREKRVKIYLAGFALVTIIPSVFAAWHVVQETLFRSRANAYVRASFQFKDSNIINTNIKYERSQPSIEVTLVGEPLSSKEVSILRQRLYDYQIGDAQLLLHQPKTGSKQLQQEFDQLNKNLRVGIVEDLYKKNEALLKEKDSLLQKQAKQIQSLEQELLKLKSQQVPLAQIAQEVKVQYPNVEDFAFSQIIHTETNNLKSTTIPTVLIHWKKAPTESDKKKLVSYLKVRLNEKNLTLLNH